ASACLSAVPGVWHRWRCGGDCSGGDVQKGRKELPQSFLMGRSSAAKCLKSQRLPSPSPLALSGYVCLNVCVCVCVCVLNVPCVRVFVCVCVSVSLCVS